MSEIFICAIYILYTLYGHTTVLRYYCITALQYHCTLHCTLLHTALHITVFALL